ncbi:peptidase C39 [Skermanella stibiiresistens SB22]|uniref:Peptidase C39 n=1 Tax=Skermanella stibiiresistens SB22 TaxID=1385369 RepID=W9H940_9PROT|nr:type I secretion system permease/ATPase [Skermanella stibiiresistens]EWY41177.1 peptidase C39 [Skermanella stibiiresistens SB22]
MTEVSVPPPASSNADAGPDTGLVCLVLILRLLGIAASPEGLKHQYGRGDQPMRAGELLRCAKELGVKARLTRTRWDRLARTPLPAVARHRDGRFIVLAQVAADKVLVQDPLQPRPLALSRAEFEAGWTGELILLTRRAALTDANRKFGIGWFVPAIIRYRALFTEVLVASFFLQVFALISPLFFQVVIDKVLVHRGLTTLDVLVLGLVIVSVFETVLGTLRTYVFSHTTNRIDVTLGARLFRHLLALPLSYFQARRAGDSIARVRELENVRNFLTGSALTLVIDLVFTVVFLAVMYWYSPVLTWIVLATIPCYVILSLLVTPVLRRRLDEKFARGVENQAFLVETVGGVETLKAMAVEPEMHRRWEEQLAGYVAAGFLVSNLGNIAGQAAQLINKLGVAATLYFGATQVIDGDLSVGQLVAFNMLAGRVSSPVLRLAQLWQDFQQARLSIARLGDILNTTPEPSYNPSRAALPPIKGGLRFDHVTFRYRIDGAPVLHDVSIEIPAGQVVGIVGPSGSGKSTLTKLAQRLHVPEGGRVLVDGTDLALVDPAWLRRQIGVVLQENVLFNRTIRDNIALTDPGMPMERIIEAATLAGAHEFILELPQAYDTMVGERGSTLSGGQRQRIAIARALVTQPRILILDEATSALDYESESAIQRNMRRICAGRTVLIIAHRLAAVRGADRILTIEAGRLTEDGSHADLLRRNGRYASLHRLQTGEAQHAAG